MLIKSKLKDCLPAVISECNRDACTKMFSLWGKISPCYIIHLYTGSTWKQMRQQKSMRMTKKMWILIHWNCCIYVLLFSFCLAGTDLPHFVQLHLHSDLCNWDDSKGKRFTRITTVNMGKWSSFHTFSLQILFLDPCDRMPYALTYMLLISCGLFPLMVIFWKCTYFVWRSPWSHRRSAPFTQLTSAFVAQNIW